MTINPSASSVFRYYETDGVQSSGAHQPKKSDIIAWAEQIETLATALNICRSDISTTNINIQTFSLNGYRAQNDLGFGAIYTSIGATSTGLMAIQDADGTWFNMIAANGAFSDGMFGTYGDGTLHPITSGDIAANPQWRGVYGVGTSWDAVSKAECFYACFAASSTPGTIIWNAQSGGGGVKANKRFIGVPGAHQINIGLLMVATGFVVEFSAPQATNWNYVGGTLVAGTSNATTVISNVPTVTLQLLSSTLFTQSSVPARFIDGPGIPYGTTVLSVDVAARTLTMSKAATTSVSSFQGYFYSSMLYCNSASIGAFKHVYMTAACLLPMNNPIIDLTTVAYPELAASFSALMVLDATSTAPNLPTQWLTLDDCHWEGSSLADVLLSVSPRGGAAEGATIAWYNCTANRSMRYGVMQTGANALGNLWHNGDFLGNKWVGFGDLSGTIRIDNATFEGQTGASLAFAPQNSQIANAGAAAFFGTGQGVVTLSGLYNIREEGSVIAQSDGQLPEFIACGALGADQFGSFRSYPFQLGHAINPTINNAKKRTFICVDTGGTNSWNLIVPNTSPSFVITDNSGASYTVNQWVGKSLHYRFGSSGFTNHYTTGVTANTATTITNNQAQLAPAADTLYSIGGQTGATEPDWDSATAYSMAGTFLSGPWFLTKGSNTVTGPSGFSIGQYIFVPNGDIVGLRAYESGIITAHPTICAFFAKITAASGGTYTVDKKPGRDVNGGIGTAGTGIADGDLTWLAYDFNSIYGAWRVADCQPHANGRLANCLTIDASQLQRTDADRRDAGPAGRTIYSRRIGQIVDTLTDPPAATTGAVDITPCWQNGQFTPLTPTGDMTLNSTTAPYAGVAQEWTLLITTSGTSPYTLTFGTNFSTNGSLSTGSVTGVDLEINFVSVKGKWVEAGRYPLLPVSITSLVSVPKSADYTTIADNLGKSIDLTTGSSTDKTITLLAAATAGDGAVQYVSKADTGTNKVIVTDGSTVLANLYAKGDRVKLRVEGGAWVAVDWKIAPLVEVLLSSVTWTKPPLARRVRAVGVSAGGGGGSGRRGAAATLRTGGAGGGGGGLFPIDLPAALVSSAVAVTVGASGTGGAAVTTNDTNGNPGTRGGGTYFGSYAFGDAENNTIGVPAAAAGGTNATAAGGTGHLCSGFGGANGGAGQAANTGSGALTTVGTNGLSSLGGGGGGCITSADANGTNQNIRGPGSLVATLTSLIAASVVVGANGIDGTTVNIDPTTGVGYVGAPGQGGNPGDASTPGGRGGDAGYGSGGGGGGAAVNGQNSGRGGNGGASYIRVETTF